MNGNAQPRFGLQFIQRIAHLFDRLILAREGDPERRHNTDRVFIAKGDNLFRGHHQLAVFHWNFAVLDIPVARELVPTNLHRARDQVGPINRFSRCFALRFPTPLERQPTQHGRLAGASCRTAGALGATGCMPKIGQHMHATLLNLCGLGVLILVHHILVDAIVHQLVDFGLFIGLAEGGKVLTGVTIEHQFVANGRINMPWVMHFEREAPSREHLREILGAV